MKSNGSVSNMAVFPSSIALLRTELASGGYDVVHLHEPVAPLVCWDAMGSTRLPLVGTFHTYGTAVGPQAIANGFGARRRMHRLGVRIAVSEAAAWTARRFYGGRYRIVPNGVHVPEDMEREAATDRSGPLRIVFVGRPEERKGLPVLLRAFEALRDHVDATLTLVGVEAAEVEPLLHEQRGIVALGKVSTTTPSTPRCARPTSSARRRWAARASAWS